MSAPYPQLVRAGYRRYATYRRAALAGLTTNVVFGLVRAAVLTAVLAQRGTVAGYDVAVAVTTHDLPDVGRLCRRVVVIDRGQVLVDDELATLRTRFVGNRTLVVELTEPAQPLEGLPGVVSLAVEAQGLRQRLEFSASATSAADLIAAVAARVPVRDVTIAEPSIEDLVRRLYAIDDRQNPLTAGP